MNRPYPDPTSHRTPPSMIRHYTNYRKTGVSSTGGFPPQTRTNPKYMPSQPFLGTATVYAHRSRIKIEIIIIPLDAKRCIDCDSLTKKGRIRTRKYLTLLTRPTGIFMNDFYIPLLKQYALHSAYTRILSKNGCGRMRFDWFKSDDTKIVKTIRDYAERLKLEFNDEIQSEHFGASRNLSIEGCSVRYKDELQNIIMVMAK